MNRPAINPAASRATARAAMSASEYVQGILSADRTVLGRAITLLESTLPADQALAREVLSCCQPHSEKALRIAVTGAPGVGKSSLIETLGCALVARGKRLAVLTTDPTSIRTAGSILGDKTRMPRLAAHDQAFIRPSPSAGAWGGITSATRPAMLLCEAAGFDIALVETVGVGQSAVAARDVADIVLLLVSASAGDELQAVKRGIIETADIIAVAKADGHAVPQAQETLRAYRRALGLYPPGPSGIRARVLTCSAVTGDGISKVWEAAEAYHKAATANEYFERNRRHQVHLEVRRTAEQALRTDFLADPAVATRLAALQEAAACGTLTPWDASQELIKLYRSS